MSNFAERLKKARQAKGWNQSDLSYATRISPSVISRYVKGHALPDLNTLDKLCRALDVTPNDLLGYTDSPLIDLDKLDTKERNLAESFLFALKCLKEGTVEPPKRVE